MLHILRRAGTVEARGEPACRLTDLLFHLSVALLPFECLWFAPSKGWGALAPVGFFVYALVGVRHWPASLRRLGRPLLFIAAVVALTSLNFLRYPPDPAILLDVARALALGVTFLLALDIHFNARGGRTGPICVILYYAYIAAIAVGLLQCLAIHLQWQGLRDLFENLSVRSSINHPHSPRAQYTFTEPAFITMHLYGVLLPLAHFWRGRPQVWRLRLVLALFVAAELLVGSSLRFLLDTLVVGMIWLACLGWGGGRRGRILVLVGVVALAGSAWVAVRHVPRLGRIVSGGVQADDSLASRWFRVHGSLIGYGKEPLSLFTGYGLSNIWVPFGRGYAEAKASHTNTYTEEVELLAGRRSSLLCMPIRITSEFGLPALLLILALLWRRRHARIWWVVLLVYLPFDSYAFYTVWIYLFFSRYAPEAEAIKKADSPGLPAR